AIPFASASADTLPDGSRPSPTVVKLTGQINKRAITGDDVSFQIVKFANDSSPGQVVWPPDGVPLRIGAGTVTTVDMGTLPVDVRGRWVHTDTGWIVQGEKLLAQVISDSPVDPRAIDWQPVVTYQSFCHPDAQAQVDAIQA